MTNEFNFFKSINDAVELAMEGRGHANILIAGKTGVGKSTLVNTVFQGNMADTGQGKAVTQETKEYTKNELPISIFDTKGLEVKDYKPILDNLINFINLRRQDEDAKKHIHVGWICVAEGSRRIEEAEIMLAEQLSKIIPIIIVITTAVSDQGFKNIVEQNFHFARNVVRVNSIELVFDNGSKSPVIGLNNLIDLTMEVVPEGQRNAVAAAQKVNLDLKVARSRKIVGTAAISAAGIAAVPIPFSDAIAIVPIQLGMLAGISAAFGLNVDKIFLNSLVTGIFSSVAGTLGGRALVGSLMKLFPGIGSAAGAVVSGGVAATLTTTFGEAYIATLYALLSKSPDKELSADEIASSFKKQLKAR